MTNLEEALKQLLAKEPVWKTQIFFQIIQMLRWFAGKQIRNVAAVGGNIITGSPISDLNPIFMASNCLMTLASVDKVRQVNFNQDFYTGYRQTILRPDEILVNLTIPFTRQQDHFVAYKQARRRDDDIAIVNGAFFFTIDKKSMIIEKARMAFGGMSFVTKMVPKTSSTLQGCQWSSEAFEKAMDILLEELALPPDVPGSMVRYRQTLAMSLMFKAFLTISEATIQGIQCVISQKNDKLF